MLDNAYLRKDSYTAFQLYHATPQCIYRDTRCVLIGRVPSAFMKEHKITRALYKFAEKFTKESVSGELDLVNHFEMDVVETIAHGDLERLQQDQRKRSGSQSGHIRKKYFHSHHQHSRRKRSKSFAERNIAADVNVDPVPLDPSSVDPAASKPAQKRSSSFTHTFSSYLNRQAPSLDFMSSQTSASTPPTPLLSPASSLISPRMSVGSEVAAPKQPVVAPAEHTSQSDASTTDTFHTPASSLASDVQETPVRLTSSLRGSEITTVQAALSLAHTTSASPRTSTPAFKDDLERNMSPETEHENPTVSSTELDQLRPKFHPDTAPSRDHHHQNNGSPPPLTRAVTTIPARKQVDDDFPKALEKVRTETVSARQSLEEPKSFILDAPEPEEEDNDNVQELVAPLLQMKNTDFRTGHHSHMHGFGHILHKRRGEVLFVRRFLIQAREVRKPLAENAPLNEFTSQSVLIDRWKEYTVVARHTGDEEAPVALYFYKGLEVDKVERRMEHLWSRSFRFKITLTQDWKVSIYSPVDLAVALWRTEVVEVKEKKAFVDPGVFYNTQQKGARRPVTHIYIFKAQNGSAVSSLLVFLYLVLRYDLNTRPLKVHVSDFDLLIEIPPSLLTEAAKSVLSKKKVEIVSYREVLCATSSPAIVISSILRYVHDALVRLGMFKITTELSAKVAVAWRRFDRLLWVNDKSDIDLLQSWAMRPVFDLEFLSEYPESRPLEVNLGEEEGERVLFEPAPVEGFCTRHCQWSGRKRRQQLANVTYLHSHGHLLAFSSPSLARPPIPMINGKVAEPSQEIFDNLPLIWENAPYALDVSGNIDWILKCRSLKEFDAHDAYAQFERKRRATLLVEADGLLDMTTIEAIVAHQKSETGFSIVFISGKSVDFTVGNSEVRDTWVKQLNELITYWKLRKESDSLRQRAYYRYNMARLATEHDEGMVRYEDKSQLDAAMADAFTFSSSQLIRNRSVIHCDHLYMKNHKYTSFRKYLAVLTITHLILFEVKLDRTQRFSSKQQIYYRFSRSIPMKNAYFYTGVLARDHLMDRDRYFDQTNPGVKALPRAFPNGWTSQDTEIDRCLVIWSSSVRLSTADKEHRRAAVFLADSRYRRDRWATAIHHVLGNAPTPEVVVKDT